MNRFAAAAVLSALPLSAAWAQSLEEAHQAYLAAFAEAPLAVRKAVFVTGPAEGYGLQQERASNEFAPDEPIYIYIEPVGYGFQSEGGVNTFGLSVGLRILTAAEQELFAQESFLDLTAKSEAKPTEFFGNVTLNLSGLTPGEYVLELLLDDVASDETATVSMPMVIR